MKVLITGGKGQLGSDLMLILKEKGFHVTGYGREELDITNLEQVEKTLLRDKPDVVIHAAAYTKVDEAESSSDKAFLINKTGTRNIAVTAEKIGARLVYISTDYVFDGTASAPINENEATNPINTYGKSKLAGEQMAAKFHSRFFIVRTSWIYGKHGHNFVKTMLKIGQEKKEVMVVQDQFGSPTYTKDLVNCIASLIETDKYGTYHVSNSGYCSWFEFAKAIFEEAELNVEVKPCKTAAFPRPAPRPAYSVLDQMNLRRNGFTPMPDWRLSLKSYLKEQEL